VPHCFINVWRHGVQCRGVDGRPGESCFWRDVMACPVSVQERLRGWRCRGRSFGGRPPVDSRVPLTEGGTRHSSGRGDVPSPRVSTTPGMALQWLGWSHRANGDGGGRARRHSMAPRGRGTGVRPPSRVPPSSFEGLAFRPYGCGWHSAAELTPASPHSAAQWREWPHRGRWRNSTRA
jgi:hypothetical protein